MEYSRLGGSDLNVSKICLGTMTFGEQNSEAEAHQQLDLAFGCGINFIDTAGAAKYISESDLEDSAAIASKLASEIYHLKIIKIISSVNITNILCVRKYVIP